MYKNIYFLFLFFVFTSCATRNLIYFSDLPESGINTENINNTNDPEIHPVDLLSITVSTLNPESNLLFNSGVLSSMGSDASTGITTTMINQGYRVDKNGFINFPVIGKVELGGLTLDEATDKMTELLQQEAKNPIVNIKLLNFTITVVGEVNNPNTFPVSSERINVIEAIGLAGDLTAFGKRENVLLIRETDGIRTTARLDLNHKALFDSPYFYLQQNDILYVEPVKAKAEQASMVRSNIGLTLSIISLLSIFLTRYI
jgi:polysaccharide export outer membrane protein